MRRGVYLVVAALGVAVIVASACVPPPPADVDSDFYTFEIDASQVEYGPFPAAIPFVAFDGTFVSGRDYQVRVECDDGGVDQTQFNWFDHSEREVYFDELFLATQDDSQDPHCRLTETSTQGGVIMAFECLPPHDGQCWLDNGGLEIDVLRNRTIDVAISNTFVPETPTTTNPG